jgi:type IV pilus assembly protein PilQ
VQYNPFTTSNTGPVIGTDGTTVTAPSGLYASGEDRVIYDTFKALTTSKASKLVASPTIILMEETSNSGASSGSSSSQPNQATLFVGENVITGLEPVENSTACRQTFSQVGLNLKATLSKIDDNGFVTFMIEPTLTAPDSTVAIPGCGQQTIVTTSERKFVSGVSRVRDGQTLILTGVISDRESSTTSKVPLLGDIPIFGTLFRSSTTDRKKKELVLTVTPRVIKDDNQESYGYYMPSSSSIRSSMLP